MGEFPRNSMKYKISNTIYDFFELHMKQSTFITWIQRKSNFAETAN